VHATPDGTERPTRPLSAREREILAFLLSVDVEGMDELRKQADVVVARPWTCGCASVDLVVEGAAPRSSISTRPAVESATVEREDPEQTFDLLLWVEDGLLSGMEIVDYGDKHGEHSQVFPPPDAFEPPRPRPHAPTP
jgi:hypothetical protein